MSQLRQKTASAFSDSFENIIHGVLWICSVDHFYEPEDFGILEAVTIGHDNSKDYADWDFHKVSFIPRSSMSFPGTLFTKRMDVLP